MSNKANGNKGKLIPVTVLTGFLGAGKTTFVNYMMKANHGYKIAIIENEFGEVGVDHDLVMQTGEEVVEMLNGCICCTVRNDLIGALKRLHSNRRHKFDYIVIETTGMADPAPVAQTFFVEESLKDLFYLDAIITFVDCKNTPTHLKEEKANGAENEAVEQVAFADVLVLNKTDLVNKEELEAVKKEVQAINGSAKILMTQQSKVPLDQVLGIKAFDLDKTVKMDEGFLDTEAEHNHDKSVSSVGFVIEGSFHPRKFDAWLNKFLREKAQDVYRSKGVFSIVGSDERYVFQAVHMLLNMGSSSKMGCDFPPFGKDEKRVSKMCFIGKNLNRKELYESLLACVHDGKKVDPGKPPETKLRFKIGDKVQCNTGTWAKGSVVALWYREDYWESGRFAPYQVKLDNGDLIYVPEDLDSLCKSA
jgi:G3E family GTPase